MEFEFSIDGTTYIVPTEIPVGTFQRAICWNLIDDASHRPFVAALTGCPLPQLDKVDDFIFAMIFKACVDRIPTSDVPVHQIDSYHLLGTDDLTFGDFIDLDILIADGVQQHVVEITAKLYSVTEDVAAGLPIHLVWPSILHFFKWRKSVYQDYDEFFETQGKGGETDEDRPTINTLQLMWYEGVMVLAEGKFLNIHQVTDRPYREALNFLTWRKAQVQKERMQALKRKLRK